MNRFVSFLKWAFAPDQEDIIIVAIPERLVREKDLPDILSMDPVPIKRETRHGLIKKAYIEIQIPRQGEEARYETFNLKPEIAMQFNVGDKWIIERDRIAPWMNVIEDCHHLKFSQNVRSYFPPLSNRCFIQIVERFFDGDSIEIHGKTVSPDGEFYE